MKNNYFIYFIYFICFYVFTAPAFAQNAQKKKGHEGLSVDTFYRKNSKPPEALSDPLFDAKMELRQLKVELEATKGISAAYLLRSKIAIYEKVLADNAITKKEQQLLDEVRATPGPKELGMHNISEEEIKVFWDRLHDDPPTTSQSVVQRVLQRDPPALSEATLAAKRRSLSAEYLRTKNSGRAMQLDQDIRFLDKIISNLAISIEDSRDNLNRITEKITSEKPAE